MIVAGITDPLQDPLRAVLEWLHGSVGLPWAWAIVALTVIVRMLLVPLTIRQIHTMQNLQRHAPQMKEIQRKYKGDRQRMNEEMMRFYKENRINPAASCLPMLLQLPIFFALFFVLRDFDKEVLPDFPGADLGWLGIVPDITEATIEHWSGYLLLVVYVVSQIASLVFMPTTMDRTQRMILLVIPLAAVFFILNFPAGLVLYWVTTNLWTVGQGLVTRQLMPKTPLQPPRRSSRTPPREEAGDGAAPEEPQPAAPAPKTAAPRKVKRKKKARR